MHGTDVAGAVRVSKPCEGRKPLGGSDLFQEHSHDAVSSSQQGKNAMGASLQACRMRAPQGRRNRTQVHNLVSTSTVFRCDIVLNTRIITMYAMCGSPLDSRSIFDGLKRKNLFQWNALVSGLVEDAAKVFEIMPEKNWVSSNSTICGFSENGLDHESYSLLGKILEGEEALVPDVAMLVTVLPLCAGNREVNMGMMIHSLAVKLGLNQELMVNNALTITFMI
ncbi:hypothetical protein ACFX1T_007518 [Malus domestica]